MYRPRKMIMSKRKPSRKPSGSSPWETPAYGIMRVVRAMIRLRIAAVIILLAANYASAKDSSLACKTRPGLVGACRVCTDA